MLICTVKPTAIAVGVPNVGVFAAPRGEMLWVAEVKPVEAKARVYLR